MTDADRTRRDAAVAAWLLMLGTADPLALRNDFADATAAEAAKLGADVAAGAITVTAFVEQMAALIRAAYAAQYALGRGGFDAVTADDRAALEAEIGAQLDWLDGFADDIGATDPGSIIDMTDEEIAAWEAGVSDRAASYLDNGIGAFEIGKAGLWEVDVSGMETPPLHNRCRCALDYPDEDGRTVVYWVAYDDACIPCLDMAIQYGPYIPGEG